MPLSENIRQQSSQLSEPLWTDPGAKSGISVCKLISTFKKKQPKKVQAGNELSNILPKSSQVRKKPPPVDIDIEYCLGYMKQQCKFRAVQ